VNSFSREERSQSCILICAFGLGCGLFELQDTKSVDVTRFVVYATHTIYLKTKVITTLLYIQYFSLSLYSLCAFVNSTEY
jgi:hypothetical protein